MDEDREGGPLTENEDEPQVQVSEIIYCHTLNNSMVRISISAFCWEFMRTMETFANIFRAYEV